MYLFDSNSYHVIVFNSYAKSIHTHFDILSQCFFREGAFCLTYTWIICYM